MDKQSLAPNQFFALLRASLWGDPFSPDKDFDAAAIRQELRHHAIQNLPAHILAKADPENAMDYIRHAAIGCSQWYALMQVQQEVCAVLDASGIPCAVIKGAAADIHYPLPTARSMGDIDILVKPTDYRRAMVLLVEMGCTLRDDRNPRHADLNKDGITIELHQHYASIYQPELSSQLDGMLFDAFDRRNIASIEGYWFHMLPTLENGIVLIEHIDHHMPSGLGLRQIIDWMLYVDRNLDDEAWFGGFETIMENLGLLKLTVTVTRMCQLYLGLRKDIIWCQLADENLCHRLMEHILQQGNFGRKHDRRTLGAVGVLNVLDKDLNFFQVLQRHGCYNWKSLKKYPWLKPFAWLYQLCRYIRKGLRGRHPIAALLRAFRKKSQDSSLLTELGVHPKKHVLEYKK